MDAKDRKIEQLERLVAELLQRVDRLESELAKARKDSSNSSKPPSSDIVKPTAKRRRRKRKPGGQPGHAKHQRKPFEPDQVDKTIEYELTDEDAIGLTPLDQWQITQQIELVEQPFIITEHRARQYCDERTGAIITAPLPQEIAATGLVGPRLSAVIAYQKTACHMSYTTIQNFWREVGEFDISRGQLAKVVGKVSRAIEAPYNELKAALVTQDRLGIDESGHKNSGKRHWTWCFRAADFTVFHIDPSRGSVVLRKVLGETFGGVIGCDYFSAYRKYMGESGATVQFCMAHLIRDVRFLAEHSDKSLSRFGEKLLGHLRKIFDALHRPDDWTAKGFARRMQKLRDGFLKQVRHPPSVSEANNLASRFRGRSALHYFTFLTTPGVEPTNNLTEQSIRHIVIDRRITQGTRSESGMRWCERSWTILATCRQQSRAAFEFLHVALVANLTGQPAPSLLS
jgi:transposase